jgi:hypothetical protein
MDDIEKIEKPPKIRTMQAIHGERTFVLCIPKDFIEEMRLAKGDYVKCWLSDRRLVIEKAEV